MKTILFSLMLCFTVSAFSGYSQLKVYSDNRVKVFGDKSTDDPNKDLSLQVYGKYGSFLANGRIGFGEYNIGHVLFDVNRVYVGELGTNYDSDRLELCGSKGVYLTWGKGYEHNNIIAKLDLQYGIVNNVFRVISSFKFNTDVYAHGLKINSDKRFKEHIAPIGKVSSRFKELVPVSYKLKPEKALEIFLEFTPETEKEALDQQEFMAAQQKLKVMNKERYGFVAQQLKEVFPELVVQMEDGLCVDYLGMVPIFDMNISK